MNRRYREHDIRTVTDLAGLWDFAFLGDVPPESVGVDDLSYTEAMPVPGCFDATPEYAGARGLVAYHREIELAEWRRYRLVLYAVHHWCRVLVDGRPIADHAGGFTRFAVDFVGERTGTADLVILVDNRFDFERSPLHHEYFDWYHFGGVAGGAELHSLGTHWIDRVEVATQSIDPPRIRVTIAYGADVASDALPLSVTLGDQELLSEAVELAPGGGVLERTFEVPGVAAWTPSQPNLHLLHVRWGEDDLRVRFGLRKLSLRDRDILINGEPIRLLGFNRHAAHPQFGHALPEMVMVSDVQQLKDLRANFVRGSHYPQDPRFLDLCDENGICVWSEAIGWQHTAEHLTDPHFIRAQLTQIDEMVDAAYNHPSVILWGILNESHSHDPACRDGYASLVGRLRDRDDTRPVTYASNHPFEDLCLDLVDVVSINCYPGWYGTQIATIPEEIDRIVAHLDAHGCASKPLIISEIGAGAIRGWRDWNGARWSESYQSNLLETVIRHLFVERERAAGLAIWQFCDCRSSELVRKILGRPRGFNNKGIVDEYRRPKEAYGVVKKLFAAISAGEM
jgi:beta-glucuronidase